VGRQPGKVFLVEEDFAPIRPDDSGKTVQQGGLARAVGADERGDFPLLGAEAYLGQRRQPPEMFA
jgi:hypothetical protein